jgi:LacI family transcriptional regulator
VLGVDNDDLIVTITKPMLASIDVNAQLIGFEAAAMLDGLFQGKAAPKDPKLIQPGSVILRGSADVFAIVDVEVAEALRFIRENAANPLRVQDVLKHLALSRRTLERRFMASVGRTPLEEIHRVHLERARQLLIETDMTIPEVAERAGFGDDTRFNFLFRRATGTTPTGYRKQFRPAARES